MLSAGGQHPIRFDRALGDEVVDERADVRRGSRERHVLSPEGALRGVDARNNSLRSRLFVTRRSVDLPSVKEPRHLLCFKSRARAPLG